MLDQWSGGILKSQNPSTKLQTNLKFQYPMTKTQNRFGISNFGRCDLFAICDLEFLMLQYSKTARHLHRQSHYDLPLVQRDLRLALRTRFLYLINVAI